MKYMLLIYCDEKIWNTLDRLQFRDPSVAARIPPAIVGTIEIRPVEELAGMP